MGVSKIEKAQHCAMKTENTHCNAEVPVQLIHRLGPLLQEFRELRARQDRLRLAERLDFLVAGRLPDLEVLQRGVARLVQISVLVHELLLLIHGRLLRLLGRDLVRLGRRLLLGLVRDVARLLLDRLVRVLHVRLVRLLGIGLSLDRLGLQRLRVPHDLLEHSHDTTGARGLLILLEARRRRRADRLLLRRHLKELLREDGREHVIRLLEERLRLALVRNGGLEVLVLHLAVLTGALQLRLHLRDLRLQRRDGLRQLVDRGRQVRDLGLQLRDVARLELRLTLVRVQALGAEVLVLDLVRLLLQQRSDHLINGRLHLGERVEADACRERGQGGLPLALAALKRSAEALSRFWRSFFSTFVWMKLKVRVKVSCASSLDKMASASLTALISPARAFWRSSHSWSVIWHVSFRFIKNFWSAESEFRVSSRSCFDCASFSSVSASSCVFVSFSSVPALISASFAALRSSSHPS